MTAYVGIGAARIQTWLLRTPNLAGMRGASKALSAATANAQVKEWLHNRLDLGSVGLVDEAGDVDGVVVVQTDLKNADVVVRQILTHLSGELPGLEWEAWWCDASSYLDAYALANRDDERVERLTWLPATQDVPVLRSCECRHEPSGAQPLTWPGKETRFSGADCAVRHAHHPRSVAGLGGGKTPESASLWSAIPGTPPDDLTDLARRGGVGGSAALAHGRKDSRNHTATVVADGNAMGRLFELIADGSKITDLGGFRSLAVAALNTAAADAVLAGARRITPVLGGEPREGHPEPVMAVIPHFVGGDDIFVSVPAPLAWEFVATLALAFGELQATLDRALKDLSNSGVQLPSLEEAVKGVSLGVGLCFSHASHPIAETHAAAERAMQAAKKAGAGASSVIGWTDLTEGPVTVIDSAGPKERRVISLDVVVDQLQPTRLPDVFSLTPSARAMLASILRDVEPAIRERKVDHWASRVGWVRTSPIEELPALLSRARWWPGARHTEIDRGRRADDGAPTPAPSAGVAS